MSEGETEVRPDAVATTMGKKQTRKTTATLGSAPNPIHSTKSGAMATFGID